jgi:uncharacterized protein
MKTDGAAAIRSALFECVVRHERLVPKSHAFAYRLFYLAIDLDELPELSRRLPLFSVNRANLVSMRERDYLPITEPVHNASRPPAIPAAGGAGSLKERVAAFCLAHGIDLGAGARVVLVTLPRIAGYLFNPVSFYFCADRHGAPLAAIVEVTNTFREVKAYFVPRAPAAAGVDALFHRRTPKDFYVSPFSPVNLAFDFSLRRPGERLAIRIDDFAGAQQMLHSTLTGRRVPLTNARLAWFLVKYPLVTLKVIGLIHWEAFRLWRKDVPFFRKNADADRQCDLHRPHTSLVERTP